jgi:hypothetical protein
MREVAFPMNMKMTDVNRAKLEPEDMKDFRFPQHIFCEYASIMKGFNKECQYYFMKAMGIAVDEPNVRVDWENFIKLNTLLRYNTASLEQYLDFFEKVLNPDGKDLVPKE